MLFRSTAPLAWAFPTKPVTLIVPQVAGGANDVLARMVAAKLQEYWGSPVLVDGALIFNCDGRTDPFVVALGKAGLMGSAGAGVGRGLAAVLPAARGGLSALSAGAPRLAAGQEVHRPGRISPRGLGQETLERIHLRLQRGEVGPDRAVGAVDAGEHRLLAAQQRLRRAFDRGELIHQ